MYTINLLLLMRNLMILSWYQNIIVLLSKYGQSWKTLISKILEMTCNLGGCEGIFIFYTGLVSYKVKMHGMMETAFTTVL
jgi:hypothetical protein